MNALDAVAADLHGGQAGRAVQADDAAHAVAGGHDGAVTLRMVAWLFVMVAVASL